MFQFRRFPSYTYLFSIWWQVINLPDCSIRKSADRHVFAIPRSLSQLITSFVGSQCQGIRPAPFFTWPFFAFWIPLSSRIILSLVLVFQLRLLVVFLPKFLCSKNFTSLCFTSSIASYSVFKVLLRGCISFHWCWWAQMGSNHRPRAYQARALAYWAMSPFLVFRFLSLELSAFRLWWRWRGSNSRPPACKAGALPTELHPRAFFWKPSQGPSKLNNIQYWTNFFPCTWP